MSAECLIVRVLSITDQHVWCRCECPNRGAGPRLWSRRLLRIDDRVAGVAECCRPPASPWSPKSAYESIAVRNCSRRC